MLELGVDHCTIERRVEQILFEHIPRASLMVCHNDLLADHTLADASHAAHYL